LDETLNVENLIEILQKYPKNMKVMTTWESTVNSLKKENIYQSITGSLYLDADGNFYKKDFSKNPIENE
jgi:hypothetical protein